MARKIVGAIAVLGLAYNVGRLMAAGPQDAPGGGGEQQRGAPPQAQASAVEAPPQAGASEAPLAAPLAAPGSEEVEYPRLAAVPRERGARIWKAEELSLRRGEDPGQPLLLCVLGEVYDVGTGARFYAPGRGYHELTGGDRSRRFSDTELSDGEDAMSRVEDLPAEELSGILGWQSFYRSHDTYRFVGFLEGRYFDGSGAPTEENLRVQTLADAQAKSDDYKKRLRKRYLGCNMKYVGGSVTQDIWCDDSYHGPGSVPVHLYIKLRPSDGADGEPQPGWCACVSPRKRAKADADAGASAGRFWFKDYPECPAGQQRCQRQRGAALP